MSVISCHYKQFCLEPPHMHLCGHINLDFSRMDIQERKLLSQQDGFTLTLDRDHPPDSFYQFILPSTGSHLWFCLNHEIHCTYGRLYKTHHVLENNAHATTTSLVRKKATAGTQKPPTAPPSPRSGRPPARCHPIPEPSPAGP